MPQDRVDTMSSAAEFNISEHYANGCRAMGQGNLNRAVLAFARALAEDPHNALHLHSAAVAAARLNQLRQAEALFRRAIAAAEAKLGRDNSTVATIAFGLIDMLCKQSHFDEAELLCRRLLKGLPLSPVNLVRSRVLVRLAELYHAQDRLKDAERTYLAAIAERTATFGGNHPRVAEILPNLADIYRAQGRVIEAAEVTSRALRINFPTPAKTPAAGTTAAA